MVNQSGLYELMIIDLRTQEIRNEQVQISEDDQNEIVDFDSNMYVFEEEVDNTEEQSLLSKSILMNDNALEHDETKLVTDENGSGEEIMETEEIFMGEEDIDDENVDKVRERLKSMIIEGLGRQHWDTEIRMCIEAEKEHLEYFAEKSMNEISINEDLKFNLQKSISNNNLKFKITIANKSGTVVEMAKISVQRLIYFSEKRKKKEEISSLKWSKADKVEYQKWLRENYWEDTISRGEVQIAIRQSIRDETEDDFSDEVIRSKSGVAMPIFTMREGDETIEIDIIPGSDDSYMTLDDMMKATRGLHFVILRSKVKGGYLKGVLELENCGDRVRQIISAKMIRIISEAKIEPNLSKMELERIDTTMEGPNSLLGVMWKAGWISVQGLNTALHENDKVSVIREIMKSLQLSKSMEGEEIITEERIREGVVTTQLRQELRQHINIILIRLKEEVEISWDKGYVLLPDQMVWTQKKFTS